LRFSLYFFLRITTSAKGDSVTLHHILQNSRLYQEKPLASLEFPIGYAMTLEALLLSYPKYVAVRQLPPPDAEDDEADGEAEVDPAAAEADLIELVETLFEEGLIEITNDPSIIPEELRKGDEDSDEGEEEDDEEEEGEDGEEMEDGEEEEGEDEEEQE
jgi:hypothetical protein